MEEIITLGLVLSVGFSLLIFLAKQQFKDIKDGIAQTTQQIKENDKKTNERIDRLESKTEAEIANIKNDLSGIKGDFATTFVQREDFFRSMNGVEDSIRKMDNKVDRLLINSSGKGEIKRNKAVRGFIIRSLVKGYNYTAITRQIAGALWSSGLILSPDISKYIDYLVDAGYVEITGGTVKAFRAYQDDAILKLTKEGVDLAEGTTEDPGVDI